MRTRFEFVIDCGCQLIIGSSLVPVHHNTCRFYAQAFIPVSVLISKLFIGIIAAVCACVCVYVPVSHMCVRSMPSVCCVPLPATLSGLRNRATILLNYCNSATRMIEMPILPRPRPTLFVPPPPRSYVRFLIYCSPFNYLYYPTAESMACAHPLSTVFRQERALA